MSLIDNIIEDRYVIKRCIFKNNINNIFWITEGSLVYKDNNLYFNVEWSEKIKGVSIDLEKVLINTDKIYFYKNKCIGVRM